MIKKLRRNFIIVTMISVIAVLAVIVSVMNIANFINSDSEADALLSLLADNNGSFGMLDRQQPQVSDVPPSKPRSDDDTDDDDADDDDTDDDDSREPGKPDEDDRNRYIHRENERFGMRNMFTAETPYETRFFTVLLKSDGTAGRIDTGKIAAVSTDDALEIAKELMDSGITSGYYRGVYKFRAQKTIEGTLYIFVDRSRALRSVRDFMLISLLVSLGAAAAIFILVYIFSGVVTKPIAESYEKQKRFITNAGHELKTPLAVINSCTEVIELENGESKWTNGITNQTERLASLTNDLVALARMDEGSSRLNIEEFDVTEAINDILEPFSLMAEQKGLSFTADIRKGLTFKGDRASTERLCSIMADNALKYTPDGGYVRFTLTGKGKHITLSSENTAEGIEKGSHPELFDRFHRGDASHNSDIPGYGIGLSMAQSIAAAHGGRIDAVSKDGKSLTITARL